LTHNDTPFPPERPATRRLEAALSRLEGAAARAASQGATIHELEAAAAQALAALDRVLERTDG